LADVAAPAPRLHATNNVGDLGIRDIEQVALTDQRVLDLAGELEPLFARARAEIAERADGFLPRSFGGVDGFDQHVIDVALAFVKANRFADLHNPPYIKNDPFKSKQVSHQQF